MYALIQGNMVRQLAAEVFPVSSELSWIEIPQDVEVRVGDGYDGEFIPAQPTINDILTLINNELVAYIATHYDQGTQLSLLALYANPDTPAEIKVIIKLAWDWVQSILSYYYRVKGDILAGQPYEWDLSQFNATDPAVSLAALLGGG